MALWHKVKRLDQPSLCEITTIYSHHNIPVEVRDFCSDWIEASIKYLQAEAFVSGLCLQIQERLSRSGNNIPFYIMHRLLEFQNTVASKGHGGAADLHRRFLTCLEAERMTLKSSESQGQATTAQEGMISRSGVGGSSGRNMHIEPEPVTSTLNYDQNDFDPRSKFLGNPTRIEIDSEMNGIFEAVWSLDEANNSFINRCHDLKRNQELKDQYSVISRANGIQQPHNISEFHEMETQIIEARNDILQTASVIYGRLCEVRNRTELVIQKWQLLKSELNLDLHRWTQEQRSYANGKSMKITIDKLQYLSEYLMEVLMKLRSLLQTTWSIRQGNAGLNDLINGSTFPDPGSGGPDIPEHLISITELIRELVKDTFIVINQPSQVLRNNTRFHIAPDKNDLEVGLLVGEKLGLQLSPPNVSVCIIDQNSMRRIESNGLQGEGFQKVPKQGKLFPDRTRLDFNPETKRSAAVFRQIALKDYFRNGRRGASGKEQSECVTEEKLCLLFRSEFSVGDINFQIWTTSLPIVITTHVSQDCLAWGVISWDNALAQVGRVPFQVPDHASWTVISEMLNNKFQGMVGAPLTLENLKYLECRLIKTLGFPDQISWNDLFKADLPDMKFSFWKWFYDATKLIEQHLKDAWRNGHIIGFVDKEEAKALLCSKHCSPGTFLLRFSDTVLGGISIVWLHSDGNAYCLSPFRGSDLSVQPLAERLTQESLHYVYPNVPKEVAFRKYFEDYKLAKSTISSTSAKSGYIQVRNQLIIDNPNIPKFYLMDKSKSPKLGNNVPQLSSTCATSTEVHLQTNEANFIELDLDKIVNAFASSPEYYVASPDTTFQPSPGGRVPESGDGVGIGIGASNNEFIGGGGVGYNNIVTYSDDSFFMQL